MISVYTVGKERQIVMTDSLGNNLGVLSISHSLYTCLPPFGWLIFKPLVLCTYGVKKPLFMLVYTRHNFPRASAESAPHGYSSRSVFLSVDVGIRQKIW